MPNDMKYDNTEDLHSLVVARDVLQKQIDARVALRRQEMLLADEFHHVRKTRRLSEYLSGIGFRIVSYVEKERVLNETRAANLMFEIKDVAVPIFKCLVAKCNREREVSLDGYDGVTKNSFLQLCNAFEKLGWIKTERTRRSLRIVRLNDKKATNFWSGSWAEYVNRALVVKTLQRFANTRKCRFDVFYDIKLAKCEDTKNPVDMQLDLAAQFPDRFYIFETKTGILNIDKWVDRARLFGTDKNRFITCCTTDCLSPRFFKPLILIPIGNMEVRLMELLHSDFPAE